MTGPIDTQPVADVIADVKNQILGPWTGQIFPAAATNWSPPAGTRRLVFVGIGGGRNGVTATDPVYGSDVAIPGQGGGGGAHIVIEIDPQQYGAFDIQVPPAGSNADVYLRVANPASPHTGLVLVHVQSGLPGGIVTPVGYAKTLSAAGSGGIGGSWTGNAISGFLHSPGAPGAPSHVAAGGAGGAKGTSSSYAGKVGSPGGVGSTSPFRICGGGGGGGGGSAISVYQFPNTKGGDGGDGGNGGFPGGGGGGGGGATWYNSAPGGSGHGKAGAGGRGAAGVALMFWK